MKLSIIPKDSILQAWTTLLGDTEIPTSYQICSGASILGALLKRQVWIDQHSTEGWGWNVYPNQSLLLIGPSGIGKDTCINYVQASIEHFNCLKIIGGRTIENFYQRLLNIGDPAAAFVPIRELSAFFGSKDYQSSMIQEFTDLLSTGESKDVSTKTDIIMTGPKIIKHPTLTLHAGSTEEWLHKAMPDGTMEGGFLGRFLILVEGLGKKQVPLMKGEVSSVEERRVRKEASQAWNGHIGEMLQACRKPREMILLEEAKDVYTNWYYNRFKLFSKAVLPYANRSRDTILRLAMLSALSRRHWEWIEDVDIGFGIAVMGEVAKGIDKAILPPTLEAKVAEEILMILPASTKEIVQLLGRKYTLKTLQAAEQQLVIRDAIVTSSGKWIKK